MQDFIDQLTHAPGPYSTPGMPALAFRRRGCLVENLHLDAPSLQPPGWRYPADMPSSRGGNLSPPLLAEAKCRLDAHASVRTYGASFSTLLNKAGEALSPSKGAGTPDHFCRVAPSVPSPSPRLWYVTTLSALQYSFAARGSWQKSLYDWLNAADPAACPVQPTRGMIGLGRPDSVFWLSDQSPLEFIAANGLTSGTDDAAWAVMRELALPGFETRTRRKTAMGMVCVAFAASLLVDRGNVGHVWKPTALDALNYKGYCFLPGRISDPHGLTWPLRKDLRNHMCRDGLREFVHPRIEVPALESGTRTAHLLGFLDPDAETTWHSHRPS